MSCEPLAARVVESLGAQGKTLALAESLTGGGLAASVVSIPGASNVFRGGVVAYQPEIKTKVLGVPTETIQEHTTVSSQVASLMAKGVLKLMDSDFALSTTGVAGPGPNEGHKAGTVYVCFAASDAYEKVCRFDFEGDRAEIRRLSVDAALRLICEYFDA